MNVFTVKAQFFSHTGNMELGFYHIVSKFPNLTAAIYHTWVNSGALFQ